MNVCTCVVLFRIFAYTNSLSWIGHKKDHRGVKVPQQIVNEYSNEEYYRDTNNLDNVHNFITRTTTLNTRNKELNFRAQRVETLTDFIQKAVHILNTYEDTAFEDFFHILDSEIWKYHYKGSKFSELMQNHHTKRLVAGSLKFIRGKPVAFTKASINEVAYMLRDETYDKNVKELLDYIDSLYRNTELNFHSILNDLKYYRKTKSMKTHKGLVQFIRGGFRNILFDHYSGLNSDTRRELKNRIETFCKQLKNNTISSAEINDIPYTNPVIKSIVDSIKGLKNPKPDTQTTLENKSDRVVSIETYNQQFQDDAPEINESGNEFWKPATDHSTDEIISGQVFDNRSNSIRNSQERHEEYNTQRYMTLYAEKISYKAISTKKSEIRSIPANLMTERPKVKKQPTTTSTPRETRVSLDKAEKIKMLRANNDADNTKLDISYSSYDTESGLTLESKIEPRAKQNYDEPRKHGKADESRFKKKRNNAPIISQYDAVIDVQLTNTELLKSLGMFDPVGMDKKYDTTVYPRSAIKSKPAPTRYTIKSQKLTAPSKPTSKFSKSYEHIYRKQFDESKRSILSRESHSFKQYKKDKNETQTAVARHSNNDTIVVKDFNTYLIQRIDALQDELKELRQMRDIKSQMYDNNTEKVEVSNVTYNFEAEDKVGSKRKAIKGNVIERLFNENHKLSNEEVTKENNDGKTTRSKTVNIETTTRNTISSKSIVLNNDAVNATAFVNKNTSQVTKNYVNDTNNTKETNKEVITKNATTTVTSVTNTTKLETVAMTPTVGVTRRTMAYTEPSYYDYKSRLDPFGHMSDGFHF